MRRVLIFLISIGFIACANKFALEKEMEIKTVDAYYQSWTAGVKGGGSGLNIYLTFENESNLEGNKIQIKGIYFQEKYCDLKEVSSNKYQGFIKIETNSKDFDLESIDVNSSKKEVKKEEIPFKLNKNEAVLCFIKKGEKKYYKLVLKEKDLTNVPM